MDKLTCIWDLGMEHSGEVQNREVSFGLGAGIEGMKIPMCEACFIRHNRIVEITEIHNCDGRKALRMFYEENDMEVPEKLRKKEKSRKRK